MKIYISYFYQIRFFTPNMIPLSTCISDPPYFHNFTGDKGYQFYDKRGVLNGLRAEPFKPGPMCDGLCGGPSTCDTHDPNHCDFLACYRRQLDLLDFPSIIQRFENLGKAFQEKHPDFQEIIPVLIVYETPNNPCSERHIIKAWFKDNGYELEDWSNKLNK